MLSKFYCYYKVSYSLSGKPQRDKQGIHELSPTSYPRPTAATSLELIAALEKELQVPCEKTVENLFYLSGQENMKVLIEREYRMIRDPFQELIQSFPSGLHELF